MIVVGFGMVVKLFGYLWGVLDGRVLFGDVWWCTGDWGSGVVVGVYCGVWGRVRRGDVFFGGGRWRVSVNWCDTYTCDEVVGSGVNL